MYTLRGEKGCLSSLWFFCPISFANIHNSSLRIYVNIWHDRVTLKGTRWCAHASSVMSPVVRCTRWVHRARYRWYIAENAVTSLPFSARRNLDLLCSIKRGWAESKESIRYRRRKLQRKCCAIPVIIIYYITQVFDHRELTKHPWSHIIDYEII